MMKTGHLNFGIAGFFAVGAMRRLLKDSHSTILSFQHPSESKIINLVIRVRNECGMLLTINEAYQVFSFAQAATRIEGDFAEVGVYTGGTAKLIGTVKGSRPLHLFDTFEGLPEPTEKDGRRSFYKGQFPASLDGVKDYLRGIENVHFYKGLFPRSAEPIKQKRFAFVHLDLDIYQSTYDALEFFYPQMKKGGIILSNDYHYEGVHKAFDEVFCDKPETVLSISARQALVVKL